MPTLNDTKISAMALSIARAPINEMERAYWDLVLQGGGYTPIDALPLLTKRAAFMGDSITAQLLSNANTSANGIGFHWVQAILGERMVWNPALCKGIGGNTTTQMLARYQTDIAANYALFDILFFEGGTNDVATGVSGATVVSNIKSMLNDALLKRKRVVLYGIFPRNGFTVSQRRTAMNVNNLLRIYADSSNGIIFIDAWRDVANPTTGAILQSISGDGTHPDTQMSINIARRTAEALNPLLPVAYYPQPFDEYDATVNPIGNLLAINGVPLLGGTTGTLSGAVSGTAAVGYMLGKSSGTSVAAATVGSKVAATSGYNSTGSDQQVITLNWSVAYSTYEEFFFQHTYAHTFPVGTQFYTQVELDITGGTRMKRMTLGANEYNGTDTVERLVLIPDFTTHFAVPDGKYILKSPINTVRVGANKLMIWSLVLAVDGAVATNVVVKLSNPTLRIVA